ncbi:peptidoglycan-binding protein [Oceanicella sp. SM1341]|uniref:peptidoglycan-binding domain-containing protein n=1 Tax=Oceanicella sp. SM1341 TaxID=1548889 RepID=UPI000E4EC042|nr:peptidoglycan-binding protein [Oceanicella sp. SM1341]
MKSFRLGVVAFATTLLAGSPMLADDLALVIGNSDYAHGKKLPEAANEAANRVAMTLDAAGYEVFTGTDLTSQDMFDILSEFNDRLPEADRIVIYYSGNPVSALRSTWLTPVDMQAVSPVLADFTGPSLDLLLGMAANSRGNSVVMIAAGEDGFEEPGFGLKNGMGPPAVPKGVLYLQGDAANFGKVMTDTILRPALSATEAAKRLEGRVEVVGDVPDVVFGPKNQAQLDAAIEAASAAAAPASDDSAATGREQRDAEAEEAMNLSRAERLRIQEALTVLDFEPKGIDGAFGPNTRAAISRFQDDQELPATGYLREGQTERLYNLADKRARELDAAARKAEAEARRADNSFWQERAAGGDEQGLRAYLRRYPDGVHAEDAMRRLDQIEENRLGSVSQQERQAWQAARRTDTPAAYREYLRSYPDSQFANAANTRMETLLGGADVANQRDQLAAREEALRLSRDSLQSVEQRLDNLGFPPGRIDGTVDGETRIALRRFQRSRGLEVTGFLDDPTLRQLVAASG